MYGVLLRISPCRLNNQFVWILHRTCCYNVFRRYSYTIKPNYTLWIKRKLILVKLIKATGLTVLLFFERGSLYYLNHILQQTNWHFLGSFSRTNILLKAMRKLKWHNIDLNMKLILWFTLCNRHHCYIKIIVINILIWYGVLISMNEDI